MPRRLLVALVFAALGAVSTVAEAQTSVPADLPVAQRLDLSGALVNTSVSSVLLDADQLPSLQRPIRFKESSPRSSTSTMMPLYVWTAAMQVLDIHSTYAALDRGAVEVNPLMSGMSRNKAAFVAMKAGVAASTIFATRNMAKRNKIAAIVTSVAINSAYALVVSHNYRVARRQN